MSLKGKPKFWGGKDKGDAAAAGSVGVEEAIGEGGEERDDGGKEKGRKKSTF